MFDGQILKRIREKENLTQGEFAGIIGVTAPYISSLEANKKQPSLRLLKRVEKFFPYWFNITCHSKTSKVVI